MRDWHEMALPVPRIFVPETCVTKLKIPGLFQRFLSQSQGFVSFRTTFGQPEFFGLLGTRDQGTVPGFWVFFEKYMIYL